MKALRFLSVICLVITSFGAVIATVNVAKADIFGTDYPADSDEFPNPRPPACIAPPPPQQQYTYVNTGYVCKMSPSGKWCTYRKKKVFCTMTGVLMLTSYDLQYAGQSNMHCVDNGDGTSHCQSN